MNDSNLAVVSVFSVDNVRGNREVKVKVSPKIDFLGGVNGATRITKEASKYFAVVTPMDSKLTPVYLKDGVVDIFGEVRLHNLYLNDPIDNETMAKMAYDDMGRRTLGDTDIRAGWTLTYNDAEGNDLHEFIGILTIHSSVLNRAKELSLIYPGCIVTITGLNLVRCRVINGKVSDELRLTGAPRTYSITDRTLVRMFNDIELHDICNGIPKNTYSLK